MASCRAGGVAADEAMACEEWWKTCEQPDEREAGENGSRQEGG